MIKKLINFTIDNIYIGAIIITLIGSIFISYKAFTIGSKESDFEIRCIYGQEFYVANFWGKGFMGNRLHDDGTPFKCEN